MNSQTYRKLAQVVGVIGAILSGVVIAHAGSGLESLFDGVALWVVLPYLFLAFAYPLATTRGRAIASVVLAFLVAAFGAVAYITSFSGHVSSTAGLIFIFVPLYQIIAIGIFLLVLILTRSARNGHRS